MIDTNLYTGQAPVEPKNPCKGCKLAETECYRCEIYASYLGKKTMYQSWHLKQVTAEQINECWNHWNKADDPAFPKHNFDTFGDYEIWKLQELKL